MAFNEAEIKLRLNEQEEVELSEGDDQDSRIPDLKKVVRESGANTR